MKSKVKKNVYLVCEARSMMGSVPLRAFSSLDKALVYSGKLAKRQKNKPQYDDWGLCEGIDYVITRLKVE